MKIFRSMVIAFSLYSRIPVPLFTWNEKDMKHVIAFLPFVGAVIGLLEYGAIRACIYLGLPCMVMTLILTAIPILVTGGFHLDGFMDVKDALSSYQSKEKKLEIMKDPHIGAFAVISVLSMGLIWTASLYYIIYVSLQNDDYRALIIFVVLFALVRAVCGVTCISFPNAKKESMLNMESGGAGKGDIFFLVIQGGICLIIMLLSGIVPAVICAAAILLFSFYYKKICDKNFGGITGDTSGYFIVSGECLLTFALAVFCMLKL